MPWITEHEVSAVTEVLRSGHLAQGAVVAGLERRFADLAGTRHAVATSSGTTALHLALLAHGVGAGDEVITTSFSFIATANAILFTGATPVFVDIEEDTFNLDVGQVEAAVTSRTKALLPVHLYGQPAELAGLMEIAARHGLSVVEDCAQAIGARYGGRPVGSFGTGVFSLYATKNVMSAEGGMITTDDDAIARSVRILRNQGMADRYEYVSLGYNFRMTDVHAAIGAAQMDRLDEATSRRRRNAATLSGGLTSVLTPGIKRNRDHVWHQYTVRVPGPGARDVMRERLAEAGVGSGVFYPATLPEVPHISAASRFDDLPVATRISREVLSLPVHPLLGDADLQRILEVVNSL